MRYFPILPIGMHSLYDESNNKNIFVLPQLMENDEYKDMIFSRYWDRVIIDNGVYENDVVSLEKMVDIANDINSKHTPLVVLPECENHCGNNIEIAKLGLDAYDWTRMFPMHIFQGEIAQYRDAIRILSKECANITFGLPVSLWRQKICRASIYNMIENDLRKYYVHAFGLDSVYEIFNMRLSNISSVDSSICATIGNFRLNIMDVMMVDRSDESCYLPRINLLDNNFSDDEISQTRFNIGVIHDLCMGR